MVVFACLSNLWSWLPWSRKRAGGGGGESGTKNQTKRLGIRRLTNDRIPARRLTKGKGCGINP